MELTSAATNKILTRQATSVRQPPQLVLFAQWLALNKILKTKVQQELNEPVCSPLSSPIPIGKKRGPVHTALRGYKLLNDITKIKFLRCLSPADNILNFLAGCMWCSTLDLKSGYWRLYRAHDTRAPTEARVTGQHYDSRAHHSSAPRNESACH